MAKRQDSGSSSAHENQRPNAQNEEGIPEMTDEVRNIGDMEDEDEFEETDDPDEEEDDRDDE